MSNEHLKEEWYRHARMDIATAQFMQDYEPLPAEIICLHCQQAGEKILKGMLAAEGLSVPKTHRLDILLKLLMGESYSNEPLFEACDELSQLSTVARYPSPVMLNEQDMRIALDALATIVRFAAEQRHPIEEKVGRGPWQI